jgi:protein O-mannosyl-transferase
VVTADVRRKALAEDLSAYTKLLQKSPDDPLRHDAVAGLYFEDGRPGEAIAEYKESLRLNPQSAPTQYNLGIALSVAGRRDEAIDAFEAALRLNPDYAQAHTNLGALQHAAGRTADAMLHYRRAIALRPDNVEAHANLGLLLSAQGRSNEAVDEFKAAIGLNPENVPALAGLAWIRATANDASVRDPLEAIRLAERAIDLTAHTDIASLDALAAAYAAAGRFEEAISAARAGIDLAAAAGIPAAVDGFRARLQLYQQGQPYRVPTSKFP